TLMILAAVRVAAAGQDAAAMPLVGPIAQTVVPEADATQETREQQPPEGVKAREPRKKRDKLRLHWRSASLDYGKKFRIDFRSRMRAEVRASDAAVTKDALDELDIPRRRVGFDGRILQAAAFKVDYEIDSANHLGKPTPPWRDVYIDITQLEEAQFRYGQFKMPFSLDENTGSNDLDFAYRSTSATLLAPSRASGWMLHGDTVDRFVGYEYGAVRADCRH